MKKLPGFHLIMFLFFAPALILQQSSNQASTQPPGLVWFGKDIQVVNELDKEFELALLLTETYTTWGIDVELSYQNSFLEPLSAQVFSGNCPQPGLVLQNSIDHTSGKLVYTAVQMLPNAPCQGGTAFSWEMKCIQQGTTDVKIIQHDLSTPAGDPVPHEIRNIRILCEPSQVFLPLIQSSTIK